MPACSRVGIDIRVVALVCILYIVYSQLTNESFYCKIHAKVLPFKGDVLACSSEYVQQCLVELLHNPVSLRVVRIVSVLQIWMLSIYLTNILYYICKTQTDDRGLGKVVEMIRICRTVYPQMYVLHAVDASWF